MLSSWRFILKSDWILYAFSMFDWLPSKIGVVLSADPSGRHREHFRDRLGQSFEVREYLGVQAGFLSFDFDTWPLTEPRVRLGSAESQVPPGVLRQCLCQGTTVAHTILPALCQ